MLWGYRQMIGEKGIAAATSPSILLEVRGSYHWQPVCTRSTSRRKLGSKETTIKAKPKNPKPVARFELGLLGKKSVALPLASAPTR